MLLSQRFDEALVLASQLHRQQVRKGTSIPYITHLLGVTTMVLENGGDEDQAIAALLHDAVEDQGGTTTLAMIRQRFGEHVAGMVEALSDSVAAPGQAKPAWEDRKVAYLDHLATAPAEMLLISLCDKLYNARAILADVQENGEAVWSKFKGGKSGTLWYYLRLAQLFKSHGPEKLAQQLMDTAIEMEIAAGSIGLYWSAPRPSKAATPAASEEPMSEQSSTRGAASPIATATDHDGAPPDSGGGGKPKRKFEVHVLDNFHYSDDEYPPYLLGTFDDPVAAVTVCMAHVEEDLMDHYKRGMTAEQLYDLYTTYGEDPFICGPSGFPVKFSGWDYAKARAQEICSKPAERAVVE